jgi:hypothetical protein
LRGTSERDRGEVGETLCDVDEVGVAVCAMNVEGGDGRVERCFLLFFLPLLIVLAGAGAVVICAKTVNILEWNVRRERGRRQTRDAESLELRQQVKKPLLKDHSRDAVRLERVEHFENLQVLEHSSQRVCYEPSRHLATSSIDCSFVVEGVRGEDEGADKRRTLGDDLKRVDKPDNLGELVEPDGSPEPWTPEELESLARRCDRGCFRPCIVEDVVEELDGQRQELAGLNGGGGSEISTTRGAHGKGRGAHLDDPWSLVNHPSLRLHRLRIAEMGGRGREGEPGRRGRTGSTATA